jgi:hypothetical protein
MLFIKTLELLGQNLLQFLTMYALSILKLCMFNENMAKLILFQPKLFPRNVYGCHTSLRGGGASVAVSEAVSGVKRRSNLEY